MASAAACIFKPVEHLVGHGAVYTVHLPSEQRDEGVGECQRNAATTPHDHVILGISLIGLRMAPLCPFQRMAPTLFSKRCFGEPGVAPTQRPAVGAHVGHRHEHAEFPIVEHKKELSILRIGDPETLRHPIKPLLVDLGVVCPMNHVVQQER